MMFLELKIRVEGLSKFRIVSWVWGEDFIIPVRSCFFEKNLIVGGSL
jgi:hypothetical protein